MMSTQSISSKRSLTSKKVLPLLTLPKLPSRIQSKRKQTGCSNALKTDIQVLFTSPSNQDDLEDIVDNLSTIVKRSEQSLIAGKSKHAISTVRRTSSLHLTHENHSYNSIMKTSNSHNDKLIDEHSNVSQSKVFIANTSRRSLRNIEKFSGIKCSLPSSTSTIPKVCQTLDKHCTPTKTRQINVSSSFEPNPTTPTVNKGQMKSPWRLRFEKFVNHQDMTPLSPTNKSVALTKTQISSSNKENRTPSFRLPTRRMSKTHTTTK